MTEFSELELQKLYKPDASSHKGQNGKLLLIGGSQLFHAASLWALNVASRIVDMVFYCSVPENNEIVKEAKKEFRDGIVVPREDLENYVDEADCILIGPGLMRTHEKILNSKLEIKNLAEINKLEDEGEQTYYLTRYLFEKYPSKRWVIDGGALQMMDKNWLSNMTNVILTPHHKEFIRLFDLDPIEKNITDMARQYSCVILCKGEVDIVSNGINTYAVKGGNAGMTKGGTGDVLAGLVASLACKNDLMLSASAGSFYNKKAGEELFKRVGYNFNASDLALALPEVMNFQ